MFARILFFLFLLYSGSGGGPVFCAHSAAGDPDVQAVIDGLTRQMREVATVRSDFVQEKKLRIFGQRIIMEGTMYLQKPDRFSWHVRKPLRYVMIMDDRLMRQWDEESGSVQSFVFDRNPSLAAAVEQIQQWFSGSYESLSGEYDISLLSEEPVMLSFSPKTGSVSSAVIERVVVIFRYDKRYIERIEIFERGGDSTVLAFTNTAVNAAIPPSAWRLSGS
ncbi:MAG: outer membrane lipoprotein carrier protein LolA [Candidatus Omnitrophica bacterium]|nr:outer membrane lipoprotein carrier protein LolA [Candidatus Omnitrophota bacterium]